MIRKNLRAFFIGVVVTFLVDQVSKFFIIQNFTPFEPPTNVIGSLLRIKLTYNPYGVFSISFGHVSLYYVLSIIGIAVLTYIALSSKNMTYVIVFGFIVGGALGNIFDRVRLAYVIDFIDMGIGNLRWFTYNFADACITVGALFLFFRELFSKQQKIVEHTR